MSLDALLAQELFAPACALAFLVAGLAVWWAGDRLAEHRWRARAPAALLTLAGALGLCGAALHLGLLASRPLARAPAGRLVDIGGGRRLHLDCLGAGVGPRVVILPGWQTPGLAWRPMAQRLAAAGRRVCIVDRAGYMWSDAGPFPRTADRAVDDARRALTAAGETGPYLLVAHSVAGLEGRLWAARRPAEVQGLVLLDSSTQPTIYRFVAIGRIPGLVTGQRWTAVLDGLGVTDLVALALDPLARTRNAALRAARAAVYATYRPRLNASLASEMDSLTQAADEAHAAPFRRDLPLRIVLATKPMTTPKTAVARREQAIVSTMHVSEQFALKGLSDRAELAWAYPSDHMIPDDKPELVVKAVEEVAAAGAKR